MNGRSNIDGASPSPESAGEIRLRARAVSRGVAIGRAVCLYGSTRQFYRIHLADSAIPTELKRLRHAMSAAKKQLARLAHRKKGRVAESGPGIFEAHLALIEDPSLQSKIEAEIIEHKVNAEWAIKQITDEYVAKYKAIEDEHLRDRYIDVEDVCDRILTALGVSTELKLPFGKNSIVVAKELKPSTIIDLADDGPLGFITENGGWTSHSFILAREMKLPAVTGVRKLLRRLKTGDVVVVDGYNGQVILNPSEQAIERFSKSKQFDEPENRRTARPAAPAKTLDRREIHIYANSDEPSAYLRAKELGAEGIGLYRSEFLFSRFRGFPTETEQYEAYVQIAEAAAEQGVKIRTFDLGADQLLDQNSAREKNPALGLRAVRLGLAQKKLLRTQLRALLRASHGRRIDIILPLVSGISELRSVKKLLAHESEQLRLRARKVGSPKLGVMIEVPSAVMMVEELAEEADFLCLGTNDLIQYLLAADRDNETVAGWYRTLHPAVLRAVHAVLTAAARAGKPAIVCGEMAGSPYYVPLLIGLGATELSMNTNSIRRIRKIISGIAAEEAERLAESIADARTVEEVESTIDRQIRKNWIHLFPKDFSFA